MKISQFLDISFIFFIMLILSIVWSRKNKKLMIFLVIITLSLYIVGTGVIGKYLANKINTPSTDISICKNTKGIILLGGGNIKTSSDTYEPSAGSYDRVLKAAETYRKYPQTIFATGDIYKDYQESEAQTYANILINLGVAKEDIVTENKSINTYQNAEFTSPLLPAKDAKYCLITDSAHLKRAQMIFAKFGVKTVPLASSELNTKLSFIPNLENIYITQRLIHECLGYIKDTIKSPKDI